MNDEKLKVLCVDDEPRVLTSLDRALRGRYEVLAANSGAQAVDILTRSHDLAVVICDMRMPEMDGATFLRHARNLRPNAIRLLLTGHADVQSAIKAINDGQIFRFLTKPCPPAQLAAVMEEAERQHELIMAEKSLLQRTLIGTVKAMVDLMSITNPKAMGRAARLKRRVARIARDLNVERRWAIEAAALFSELGNLSLPAPLVAQIARGAPLSDAERERWQAATRAALASISQVPRLGPVARIVELALGLSVEEPADDIERTHVQLLRLALDLERVESEGGAVEEALRSFGAQRGYPPRMIEAAWATVPKSKTALESALSIDQLQLGMVLADDVSTAAGVLVAPRGCEVTASLMEHLRHFTDELAGANVKVFVAEVPNVVVA
ncbi:MAG TPA: response regulator [Steroidobacteraceae bacterium]|nr:response regulator [Steroidobacteraceae bacterium]